jgi:MarR family transcriptional regulator for hemolysin
MPRDLSNTLKLSWAGRLLRTRFDARARGLGLTRAQWRVIATVDHEEGLTQSEVAARMEVASVTVGRIIDRLEEAGWIERRTDPVDRRANRLYLGAGAGPMLEKLGAVGADEERIALAGLTQDEQAQLASLLDRIIVNLKEAPLSTDGTGAEE